MSLGMYNLSTATAADRVSMLCGCDTVLAVVVWCCGGIAVPGCCGAGVIVVLCVRITSLGGCFFSSSSRRRHNQDLETLPCGGR